MKYARLTAVLVALAAGSAATAASTQRARVVETAHVPEANGARTVEVLKSGKRLETVTCRDFAAVDESFRPQALVYAANYGPKGRAHPTMTIDGVERFVPVVVRSCRARPGDHFVTAVHNAMAAQRRGMAR